MEMVDVPCLNEGAARGREQTSNGLALELRQRIVGLDVKVPVLDGARRPYVNFDNAATTPALWDVVEALDIFLPWYSSIHRGTGFKSQIATAVYDDARQTVARFFDADLTDQVVIFVKNSTEALNKAARRIPLAPDDVVLVSLMEHHSNDLPWRPQATVVHVGVTADGHLDLDDLQRKFAEYGRRVKLLAVTGASNVTGIINPIPELAELAHCHGAYILVDAAQLAAHRAIHLRPAGDPDHIDFLVASAHKMYAPYGSGVLIGPRELFAQGAPDYSGGGTVEIVTEDDVYWAAPPDRDEAGSPNVLGAVAMAAACNALREIGMDRLAAHEAELTHYALTGLRQIEAIELYGDGDPERANQRLGVIPFNVKGLSHYLVAAVLSTEYAIGVRNGCFCAHPYVLRLLDIPDPVAWSWRKQVIAGVRAHLPGLVRVSFGCYNTHEEVEWLIKALRKIARGEIAGDYEQDLGTGTFYERTFRPELEQYFKL
jgi:selenocysteine lyase/cysteine desulfurase